MRECPGLGGLHAQARAAALVAASPAAAWPHPLPALLQQQRWREGGLLLLLLMRLRLLLLIVMQG